MSKRTNKKNVAVKVARKDRRSIVLALLKKAGEVTTAQVRDRVGAKSVYGTLAAMRDAGTLDEYENDGDGGSIWALAK